MRRRIGLALVSILGFSILIFLYVQSRDQSERFNEVVIDHFEVLAYSQALLEKDILKARAFLLPDYDSLVRDGQLQIEKCRELEAPGLYGQVDEVDKMRALAGQLCRAIAENIDQVERFKSTQAVLKNSVQFISKESSQGIKYPKSLDELHHAALIFYYFPTTQTHAELERKLLINEKNAVIKRAYSPFLMHARTVMERADTLKIIMESILSAGVDAKLSEFQDAYHDAHEVSGRRASFYKMFLFLFSAVLLVFSLFNVFKLWRAGDALASANANLEKKVEDRTAELQQSLRVIADQKQSLIQSSKLSALGEMAGGIAHEINTPLGLISLQAEALTDLVGDEEKDWPAIQNGLAIIVATVTRIAKIIDGLRRFSRDAADDPMEEASVKRIVDDAVSFCAEKFKHAAVVLQVHINDGDQRALCRPVEISQVLLNLLNNAYDAIAEFPEKWIVIDVKNIGDALEFSVTDCGKGIAPDLVEKVFQPFFTTKEVDKGTGLGLSVSMGIIHSHGDNLRYDNASANTKFSFRLKRAVRLMAG